VRKSGNGSVTYLPILQGFAVGAVMEALSECEARNSLLIQERWLRHEKDASHRSGASGVLGLLNRFGMRSLEELVRFWTTPSVSVTVSFATSS
jgi:hypothetical protein